MKKIFTLILALTFVVTLNSAASAKSFKFVHAKGKTSSIQKGIKSIAPSNNAVTDPQIITQLEAIKKTIDGNNELTKQINTKKVSIVKSINEIRRNKQTLTNDQYTAVNNLLAAINTESKKIVNIKNVNVLAAYGKMKNDKAFKNYSKEELTNIQNKLNQNTVSLKNISTSYDSILSILTIAAKTTPAAITVPVTTGAAIVK